MCTCNNILPITHADLSGGTFVLNIGLVNPVTCDSPSQNCSYWLANCPRLYCPSEQ